MSAHMNASELIDALGGQTAIAEKLGLDRPNTVGNWRKRGFPAWALPALKELCAATGIDPRGTLDAMPPRRLIKQAA